MSEPAPDAPANGTSEPDADPLVRTPQQERSRRTLRRILDAGLELLREEGPDALTITGITRRAKTSVGSFYARFQGKDDLLRYLGERALDDALSAWEALFAELPERGDLRTRVDAVVQGLGELVLEGPGHALALLDGIEDPRPTRRRRFEDCVARELGNRLDAPATRIDLGARILMGILHDAVLRAHGAPSLDRADGATGATDADDDRSNVLTHPSSDHLLAELVELLVGYLGGEAREAEAPQVAETEPASTRRTEVEHEGDPADASLIDEPDPFDIWG